MNVTNTSGGIVQSNGSMALEDGHLIGYSIVLEGVTSISSEVTDVLGITQSVIANGSGSSGTTGEKEKEVSETGPLKGKAADKVAEKLGYSKTNYKSHGQPVYKKGNRYITPDVDAHNGGVWKMADSVKNLGSKSTRMGTYDANLKRIGD